MTPFPDIDAIILLEEVSPLRFDARFHQTNHLGAVFGGSILAQALVAAERTADGRRTNSLHAQFMRPVDGTAPITYDVAITREGRSFSSRHVSAFQKEHRVFEALVSLHAPEAGFRHGRSWSSPPPPPDAVMALEHFAAEWADRIPVEERRILDRFAQTLEVRVVNPAAFLLEKSEPAGRLWIRPRRRHCDARPLAGADLAFVSDYLMPAACNLPHLRSTFDTSLLGASIDHALWLHDAPGDTAWFLYDVESPWAGNGRGLSIGYLYAEDGRLLATAAQEQLLRVRHIEES